MWMKYRRKRHTQKVSAVVGRLLYVYCELFKRLTRHLSWKRLWVYMGVGARQHFKGITMTDILGGATCFEVQFRLLLCTERWTMQLNRIYISFKYAAADATMLKPFFSLLRKSVVTNAFFTFDNLFECCTNSERPPVTPRIMCACSFDALYTFTQMSFFRCLIQLKYKATVSYHI